MQGLEKELRNEKDALDQYSALTHIVVDMLESKKRECKMFFIALLCSLLVNVITLVGFLYYESQWDYKNTGCSINLNGGTSVKFNKPGLYQVTFNGYVVESTATGDIIIQLMSNGSKVNGAEIPRETGT